MYAIIIIMKININFKFKAIKTVYQVRASFKIIKVINYKIKIKIFYQKIILMEIWT